MAEAFAVLPCNGLDKPAGALAREVGLALREQGGALICPVLYAHQPARYARVLAGQTVLVVDGCGTRCASRLAAAGKLRVARKLLVTQACKELGESPGEALELDAGRLALARRLAAALLAAPQAVRGPQEAGFAGPVTYGQVRHDKFIFRVPTQGYFFNENNCWARVVGNRARVGISDYMQQQLTDLTYCDLPALGAQVEQFGEAGSVESVKAVADIISPVSGQVVAVNEALAEAPELINEDPYQRGWVAELELADFQSDRELLLDGPAYLALVKQQAAQYHP